MRTPSTSDAYYRDAIRDDVKACLAEKGGQPILFLGSGISRRYFGAPDWRGLLQEMANRCEEIKHELAYYQQTFGDMRKVGQEFAVRYKDWAWGTGRNRFPESYFGATHSKEIFLKHSVAEYLESITPLEPRTGNVQLDSELARLQAIRPHAIVTTNYDRFTERLFPEYEPVIGQKILTIDSAFFGEIFKIHGCVTQPNTIVLTEDDYSEFTRRKKYLSAKLLTFFAEHPVLLVGYSAEDPNIRAILSDIDLILSAEGQLIPNIFLLKIPDHSMTGVDRQREELIPVEDGRRVRIQTIVSGDFEWVFEIFSTGGAIERIRPKLLRSLLARTFDLVRHDIPKKTVEVDYSVLERAVEPGDELAKLYGITIIGDATHVNVGFPYSLTQVGEEIGLGGWHGAQKLLVLIKEKTGLDLKATDNKYHIAVRAGKIAILHKYSPHMVDILKKLTADPDADLHFELPD